jgi:UDP-glucose 4-epimerase
MRVGVTGHKGFVGSHVAEAVRAAGHEVVGFDLPEHDILSLQPGSFRGLDAICHIAGVGDVYLAYREPDLAVRVNVLGTQRLLQQALDEEVKRVVYASTWEVATNLDHPYNITKYGGDLLTQCYSHLYELDTVVLRLGTMYGPRMRQSAVIPKFIKMAANGERITIQGDGQQWRQFLHVRDAADAFVLALTGPGGGRVYNVTGDDRISVRQIAELAGGQIELVPARAGDAKPVWIDNSDTKRDLGWAPRVDFAEGFAELRSLLAQGS